MKNLVITLLFLFSTVSMSQAALVKQQDEVKKCTLFRVTTEQKPITNDEILVSDREIYGISFENMEIDFKNKKADVDTMINIVLGINKKMITSRTFIKESNSQFNFLINQLNRRIFLLEKICISNSNEIIYANQFESQENQ